MHRQTMYLIKLKQQAVKIPSENENREKMYTQCRFQSANQVNDKSQPHPNDMVVLCAMTM